MSNSVQAPIARFDDLVITESGSDLIAYNKLTHGIHHLNRTSAAIWKLCDGRHEVDAISIETGLTADDVRAHLDQLARLSLLAEGCSPAATSLSSRRRFLRTTALAGAVAAPMVLSMTAPLAASAASVTCGGSCVLSSDCLQNCACDPVGQVCIPDLP